MTPSIYSLFVLGAILTCLLTPFIRYLALQKGFVDCPQRARKVHQKATPRLGGAAILLSFLLVTIFAATFVPQLQAMLIGDNPLIGAVVLGSIGIFVVGFFDDLARLSPKIKLLAEFLIVGLVVWGANLSFLQFNSWVSEQLDFRNGLDLYYHACG